MVTWMPVPGYEGLYEVSDQGGVRSLDRVVPHARYGRQRRKGVELKLASHTDGHAKVHLCKNGVETYRFVHHLVLEAFVGTCPPGLEACHGNGQPDDNRLENLRWDTRTSNMADRLTHNGLKTHCVWGHEYTPENTGVGKDGKQRWCRACHRRWSAEKRSA